MATVRIKGYLVAYHWPHLKEGEVHWSFSVHHDGKLSGNEVMLIQHTFTAEVPDRINVVAGLVQGLEADGVQALKTTKPQSQGSTNGSKLLAITNKVSA